MINWLSPAPPLAKHLPNSSLSSEKKRCKNDKINGKLKKKSIPHTICVEIKQNFWQICVWMIRTFWQKKSVCNSRRNWFLTWTWHRKNILCKICITNHPNFSKMLKYRILLLISSSFPYKKVNFVYLVC